jgi:hypothetical protein
MLPTHAICSAENAENAKSTSLSTHWRVGQTMLVVYTTLEDFDFALVGTKAM